METLALPTRRERKKEATRQALRAAAVDLTSERGLAGVTIEAITERADVAPRTFFNYFSTKEEAVLGHDPDRPRRLRDAVRARPAGEPTLDSLRAVLVEDLASRALDSAKFLRLMRLIRSEPHLLAEQLARWDETERSLIAAVTERRDPDGGDLYPLLVVGAAAAAVRVAIMSWCAREGRDSLMALAGAAFDSLAAGLVAPEKR